MRNKLSISKRTVKATTDFPKPSADVSSSNGSSFSLKQYIMIRRMPVLRDLQLAPLTDENRFEELCLALWKRILNQPATQPNGRRGQRQCGVDIFGRRDESKSWVAIQCKVRSGGELSEEDISSDVESAKAFNPRLSEMIFATTARRDQSIQEFARTLTDKNLADGYFSVTVCSWDDIKEEISQEQNLVFVVVFSRGQ